MYAGKVIYFSGKRTVEKPFRKQLLEDQGTWDSRNERN
jgi:hypothetical protein